MNSNQSSLSFPIVPSSQVSSPPVEPSSQQQTSLQAQPEIIEHQQDKTLPPIELMSFQLHSYIQPEIIKAQQDKPSPLVELSSQKQSSQAQPELIKDKPLSLSQPEIIKAQQNKSLSSSQHQLNERVFKEPEDVWLLCDYKWFVNKYNLYDIVWLDKHQMHASVQQKMKKEFPLNYYSIMEEAFEYIHKNIVSTIIIDFQFYHSDKGYKLFEWRQYHILVLKTQINKGQCQLTYLKEKQIHKFRICQLQLQLENILQQISHWFTALPNFIELNKKQLLKFNNKRISLYSIQNAKGNEYQAFFDFIRICEHLKMFEVEKLINRREQLKQPKEMLREYTKATQFYPIINKCLKVISTPLQAAWVRYPYTKMRQGIAKEFKNETLTQFTVYRGTYMSQQQYTLLQKNMVYQNLGFLSTSLNQDQAKNFINNCLITIEVDDREKKSNGYINIAPFSIHENEKEILFNTNNLFILLYKGISDSTRYYQIKLKMLNQTPQGMVSSFQDKKQFKTSQQGNALKQFDIDSCIQYYQTLITIQKDPISIADSMRKIGNAYCTKGEYAVALQYYEKGWHIFNNIHGEGHISTARIIQNIAIVYKQKGQYDIALKYDKKALRIYHNIHGEGHISTAFIINNMANVHSLKREYDIALQHYDKALDIYHYTHGEGHISTALTIQNKAKVYELKGEYGIALQYFEKALYIYHNIHGEGHISTALVISNMASVYYSKEKYGIALQYYQKALHIYQYTHGERHISTAKTIQNMATIYIQKGQYDIALQYYKYALHIFLNTYGEGHISTAYTIQYMAIVHYKKGEYNIALQYFEKVLHIFLNTHGEGETAETIQIMANVHVLKGEYDIALQYYKKALRIYHNKHGKELISTANTIQNMATIYIQKGQYDIALQYYKYALCIYHSIHGEGHISMVCIITNMAKVHSLKREYSIAQQYLEKVVYIFHNKPKVDYDIALRHYLKALYIYYIKRGQGHNFIADIIQNSAINWSKYLKQCDISTYQNMVKFQIASGQDNIDHAERIIFIGLSNLINCSFEIAQQYLKKALEIYLTIDIKHKMYFKLDPIIIFISSYYSKIEHNKRSIILINIMCKISILLSLYDELYLSIIYKSAQLTE